MSTFSRPPGVLRSGAAEFHKIRASRVPQIILIVLPFACYLFAFELFHVEQVPERLADPDPLAILGLLYFSSWKTLLLPATMLAWTTVDCQYGMIRVAACQPLSRATYLLGKWLGIGAWFAIVTAAAAASFRATVGAGMVTAVLSMIALGFATMLPFDVLPPRVVLARYFFFPLGELPAPAGIAGDSPWLRVHSVGAFSLTALITPLIVLVPAVVYFARRDIEE